MPYLPYLLLSETSTRRRATSSSACLTSTFSSCGVERPCSRSHELVLMKATSIFRLRNSMAALLPTQE